MENDKTLIEALRLEAMFQRNRFSRHILANELECAATRLKTTTAENVSLHAQLVAMKEANDGLCISHDNLHAQLTAKDKQVTAAVWALTQMANAHKDCGDCIAIGDSIGKCEYGHTGDCYEWRGAQEAGEVHHGD